MASVSQWTPFGVALDISATVASVTRTSATSYTVKYNVSWNTHWDGAETNYGMKATSNGYTTVLNKFGNYATKSSGTLSAVYSISGNGAQSKSATVTFINWEENWEGTVTEQASKGISLSFTVPAWTSYTVSYSANGGSGAPGAQTKWKDQTLTLSTTKPSRTGYTFSKWNTKSDGSGTSYNPGASFTSNANTTLYAIWTPVTYRITYDANGGSLTGVSYQTKTYGVTLKLTGTASRTNYNFKGWSTNKSATTATYSTGSNFTTNAATTLYAVWELAYVKPRISGLSAERCLEDGTFSDDGTYGHVKFNWATDWTVTSVTIQWKLSTSSSWNSVTVSASGTSGSVDRVIGDGAIDTDHSYNILVTVADGNGSMSDSASINSALYPIDVLREGKGVAIGKAAELEDTFDVAFEPRFRKRINADFGLKIHDWRDTTLTPGMFGAQTLVPYFHQGGTGYWKTILDVHGWSGESYDTTQLAFPACTGGDRYLKFRCGRNGAWSGWYTLLDTSHLSIGSTYVRPTVNNKQYLGDSNYRWITVYAINGTINTSDRNLKTDIKPIEQKYIELFEKLQPVTFKLVGGEHDRTHIGFISQDVEQAMKEVDISAEEFAAFCRDIKMERVEVVDEETGEKSEKDVEVKDENGNPVYIYSLRYSEFIALNTRMIQENRRKIAEQQTEIDTLKTELAEIKALLKGDSNATSN